MSAENGRTILLVEDEAIIAMCEARILEQYGYRVLTVSSGEKALKAVEQNPDIDLILMDINLGKGMSGTEAAQRILEIRAVPLVFLSSHTEPEVVEKTEGITSYGYIMKNSGETVLLASIRMAFRLSEARAKGNAKEEALRALAECGTSTGEETFRFIVRSLAQSVRTRYAVLARIEPSDPGTAHTLAVWNGGDYGENFSYDIEGTPCRIVTEQGTCFYPRDVQRLFPRDLLLVEMGAESYWGTPLSAPDGSVLGILAVLDVRAMNEEPWLLSLLESFSARAAAEIVRLRSADALREKETRIAATLSSIGDAVISTDTEGRVIELNGVAETLTGWNKEESRGRPIGEVFRIVNAHTRAEVENPVIRALREGVVVGLANHTVLIARDGTERQIADSCAPILGENTGVLGSVLVFRDVTEDYRRREELRERTQDLRASEQRYRSMFDNALDGICLADVETGIIIDCNQAMTDLTGRSRAELIGQPQWILHPRTDQAEALSPEFQMHRTEKEGQIIETKIVTPDRGLRQVEIRGNLLDLPGRRILQGVFRDITERKQNDEILQARIRLWESAADHSLDEVLQKTLDEVCIISESPIGFYHLVSEDEKTLSLQAWSTRTLKEYCTTDEKSRHYSMDKAGVWVDCVRERRPVIHNDYASLPHRKGMPEGHAPVTRELVVPILRRGKIVAILGVGNKQENYTAQDVAIVSFFADVAWRVAEQKQTQEQVKALLAEKEIIMKEMHHRIKNNLNTAMSLLSIYADTLKESSAVEALRDAKSRLQSMSLLYDRQFRAGNQREISISDYLPALMQETVRLFPNSSRITVGSQVEDFPIDLKLVTTVGIIVSELVTNCMKYAFDGRDAGAIRLIAVTRDDRVNLVLEDNGVGIPDTVDIGSSSGFGLSLIAMLAGQINGTIRIEREQGTRVVLDFPV